MAASNEMEKILQEIDLQALSPRFDEQKININNVLSLTDQELNRLGVTTIGDRVRLRETVRRGDSHDREEGNSDPAVDMIRHQRNLLFSRSDGRKRTGNSTAGSSKRSRTSSAKRGWTVSVICLSDKDTCKVPTSDEKEVLYKAGLGLKKIKFDLCDDVSDVMEKVSSDEKDENGEVIGFPQLKNCGGYEFLKCQSNNRGLTIIGSDWTVKSLKSCLGPQAKLFIRPIQVNLSTVPIENSASSTQTVVKEACKQCGVEVSIFELRKHCLFCVGNDNDEEIYDDSFTSYSASIIIEPVEEVVTPQVGVEQVLVPASEEVLVPVIDIHAENQTAAAPIAETSTTANTMMNTVFEAIDKCVNQHIENPVEILRLLQSVLVTGRNLEISDPSQVEEGPTNFIIVDRSNLLDTAFEEINDLSDLRLTLEVQFYNEVAVDYGGPRKEFFRLVLSQIKEKYFDNGLRELLAEDYKVIGKLFSLSMLQNGNVPKFMDEETEGKVFSLEPATSLCIKNLRIGLDCLGMYTVGIKLPMIRYLFRPTATKLTVKSLINLLHPTFSEEGSNNRRCENMVYAAFIKYIRAAASGRRGIITLEHILQFTTGACEEPVLGFSIHPELNFVPIMNSFIPTANTCSNALKLPTPSQTVPLLPEQELFELYDYAFANTFYGMI
ncbi:hypothetical protein FSP39_002007 [Pinctada imbricata]|uniref:HECT-type E3 ubiquitin transferase n=1 Tax=Pinctada imbricata TaxID=66713 RepID=A0AA89BIK8_PINIB|nr:hypothetical protein FSP39_002007 [Pinctada imbricata]